MNSKIISKQEKATYEALGIITNGWEINKKIMEEIESIRM
jgi:hypothetical protein